MRYRLFYERILYMTRRILEILKNGNKYISGEKISNELGISRNAVWKHINKLRQEGYEIESVTNRGYRLVGRRDIINGEIIKEGLQTEFIGKNIVYYDEIDSTNNAAKRESGMADGTLFISEIQTSGKGRLGRSWSSPKGDGIWMSILLKPELMPMQVSQITLVAGMAVAIAIGGAAKIKWPNDIVIGTKKICGILTEMSAEIERVNYVVCGIGINVNTAIFDDELSDKATSLYIETGKKYCRADIIRRVLTVFERLYKSFCAHGIGVILDEYRKLCITLNREVSIVYNNKTYQGRAVDIDNEGNLIVETEGERHTVHSGEVSVRGIYGYI